MQDSFGSHGVLDVGGRQVRIARLSALEDRGISIARLPYALRILLENLLRREDGGAVSASDIEQLANWDAEATPSVEIAFMPSRVLLQDFTGVPAVVDLAAMRDAMVDLGGDATRINPVQPVELVIDHSVQVDEYGSAAAFLINIEREFERNGERYAFLRWGQTAFENFKVVPPNTGIVHQVNLEYLARVVMEGAAPGSEIPFAYPDTLVGTDSHTTMINGIGVLGWGVGGIEAEAAMLGQAISMLIPQVVGFRLTGALPEGATATDLVLRVVELLRARGVVGKFVEFFGPGMANLSLADRATISNMAPEYGATCGIFPIDQVSLDYLRFTNRSPQRILLTEVYMKEQGLFHTPNSPEAEYSDTLELELGTVEPSVAGPKRPQDRVRLSEVKSAFLGGLEGLKGVTKPAPAASALPTLGGIAAAAVAEPQVEPLQAEGAYTDAAAQLADGSVVIAAITSCTNTSNPSVMVAAGLVAKKAVELGLDVKPWVKTSLAPGSKVVTSYLAEAGLMHYLEKLNFHLVGYGCTTCIGNSGPLRPEISKRIHDHNLVAVAVLSGNRNFEGRISPDVRANYLASPPLVVAYALAGRIDIDLYNEPLGFSDKDEPIFLKDLWPSQQEVQAVVDQSLHAQMFEEQYRGVYDGDERWNSLKIPIGNTYAWAEDSTYVKLPPYFVGMERQPAPITDIKGARLLALLGNSITTDHISPAGAIKVDSPAGRYLLDQGVARKDFNSYGSRRGNHEVMMRGTFANVRLRNQLAPGTEGGFTTYLPNGETMSIFDAAMKYQQDETPLLVIAGTEYGTGSSRDWAAKGSLLLGIRAVLAVSFERIHRSNLIGMGVAPLEFVEGESAETLGLTGKEHFDIEGLAAGAQDGFGDKPRVTVRAQSEDGATVEFQARVRLDTPQEVEYWRHGGILHYVLRQLVEEDS